MSTGPAAVRLKGRQDARTGLRCRVLRCTAILHGVKYSEVLATLTRDGQEWTAAAPDEWTQGRTVFGGLQAALVVRAMRTALGESRELPLRSLQVTFVGPITGGQVMRFRPHLLRRGRTAMHASCDLLAGDHLACTAIGIFGPARPSRVTIEIPRPEVAHDPDALRALPHIPGITPPFLEYLDLRWTPTPRTTAGEREPRSFIFARLPDPDCSPEDVLIALADSIPTPAAALVRPPPPVSSLNWMLELLGDPALLDRHRWSLIATEVRAGTDGFLSQTSILWGPDGHAFSVSHQTVGIFG